jgi:putative SOS response-associated peptidase YedK
LDQYPATEMTATPVNPIVNKSGNEGAECIQPVDDPSL